uniref:Uncharacterized protein n=1 Tax=Tanacetum cinerariifolium TaxID=118510 RepID=A0A6L2MQQ0_TANCI|nr:hypothetical protein [Tanacetum cinerariifolium]
MTITSYKTGSNRPFSAKNKMRIIIMEQPQRQADVYQDELCPPNKCYALMDANKKIDLDNPLKNKVGVGIKILIWMITDEMKLTEHYRMYAAVFVKSHDELKAKQNVQKVKEHLIAEEIEKLVEGAKNEENAKVDSTTIWQNDNQNDPGTRLDPRSNKKSSKVEITAKVQPVNVYEEEGELVRDDYELKRKDKGKHIEEIRNTPSRTTIRSPRIHSTLISSDTKKLQELTVNDPPPSYSIPSLSSSKLSAINRLLSLFKPKTGRFT